MKITVNGVEIPVGSERSLDIRVQVDEAGEEIGPVRVEAIGGPLTIRGNTLQNIAVMLLWDGLTAGKDGVKLRLEGMSIDDTVGRAGIEESTIEQLERMHRENREVAG